MNRRPFFFSILAVISGILIGIMLRKNLILLVSLASLAVIIPLFLRKSRLFFRAAVFPADAFIVCHAPSKGNLLFEKCTLPVQFRAVESKIYTLLTVECPDFTR